ncbi:MAG: hypothetical protein J6L62_04400 [Clostridia bacterium]|nr:hypothetical protein [Clostridia bacterium]MBP3442026.1 hypothetical protein [Clostridia bacterium]
MTQANTQTTPKKVNIKKLIVPVVAAVIAIAIILGLALSGKSKPQLAFEALKKTVFESSALEASLTAKDKELYSAEVAFGEGVEDSSFDIEMNGMVFSLSDGRIKINGREYGKVDDLIETAERNADLEAYGIELNFFEVLDTLINGKIDEKEFELFYNNQFVPNAEKTIKERYDMVVELPDYETTMKVVDRFLKKGITKEALTVEKTDSQEKGKTYNFVLNTEQMTACIGEFAKKDKETRKVLEDVVAGSDDPNLTVEKFVDTVVEDYSGYDDQITGQLTISSGRITRVYFNEEEVEISVFSIK